MGCDRDHPSLPTRAAMVSARCTNDAVLLMQVRSVFAVQALRQTVRRVGEAGGWEGRPTM